MSIQPSPNSSQVANQEKWHKLLNLADNVSTQFSIKSLLFYVIQILEQEFACKVRIWLDPLFSSLISTEDIQTEALLINEKTPLMEQVYLEKRIFSDILTNPDNSEAISVLVIPLLAKDQVLGAMQLDMINQVNVTPYDLDYGVAFISQVSLALYHLLHNTHSQYVQ